MFNSRDEEESETTNEYSFLLKSDDGSVISIEVKAYKVTGENKPAAFIHWVANPIPVQVRLYERL